MNLARVRCRVCAFLLSFLLAFNPSPAMAFDESSPSTPQRAVAYTATLLQALTVLFIVTGAAMVREHLRSEEELNMEEVERLARRVTLEIIGQPVVWIGLVANAASAVSLSFSLSSLREMLASVIQPTSPIINSLQAAIAMAVTSAAWEFGEELIDEAKKRVLVQPDQKNFQTFRVFVSWIKTQLGRASPMDTANADVAREMGEAMLTILISEPSRREHIFANTFRKRIARGEFVTQVLGIAVLSWISWQILGPTAPRLASFAFGVGGGLMTMYVSDDLENAIADMFNRLRETATKLYRVGCRRLTDFETYNHPSNFRGAIKDCRDYRETLATLSLEIMYRQFVYLERLKREKENALLLDDQKRLVVLNFRTARARNQILKISRKLKKLYAEQSEWLSGAIAQDQVPELFQGILNQELDRTRLAFAAIDDLIHHATMKALGFSNPEFVYRRLKTAFDEGLNEDHLLAR